MKFTNEELKAMQNFLDQNDTEDYETYKAFLKKFGIDTNKMGDFFQATGRPIPTAPVFLNNPDWKVNNFAMSFDNGYSVSLVFDDVGRKITGQDVVEVIVSLKCNAVEKYEALNPMEYAELLHKVKNYPKQIDTPVAPDMSELLYQMVIMEALLSALKK